LSVVHVNALPPVWFNRKVDDIASMRQESAGLQDFRQWCSYPLGNVRPSFLAHNFCDLAAYRKTLQISQGKRCRTGYHSINDQPPVFKPSSLELFECVTQRRNSVSKRNFRNHAARKLASQRVSSKKPLRGVGQSFARAIDAAAVGRNEPIPIRQFGGD